MKYLMITVMMAMVAADDSCWKQNADPADSGFYYLTSNSSRCLDNSLIPRDATQLYLY
jgi:hypothetical protein